MDAFLIWLQKLLLQLSQMVPWQGKEGYPITCSHMPTPSPKLKLPALFSDFQKTIQTSVESEQAKL